MDQFEAMARRKAEELGLPVETPKPQVNTENDYGVSVGTNLPNHSTSLAGMGKFVQIKMINPLFRTKQAAYRFAAWIVLCAEILPDDEAQIGITFDDVINAIKNT